MHNRVVAREVANMQGTVTLKEAFKIDSKTTSTSATVFFAIVEFIFSIREKKFPDFFKSAGVLIIAAIIAVGMNATSLLTTYEYSHYNGCAYV